MLPACFWTSLAVVLISSASCYHGASHAELSFVRDTVAEQQAAVATSFVDPYWDAVLQHYRLTQLDESGLDSAVFYNAYTGYLNLKAKGKTTSSILTIVDFNLPSTANRMWVIDTDHDSLLLHTWAAHGKGSGREMAKVFSNTPGSLQTSLGFYLTAEEYVGKNGRSLKLDGLDSGFNTNARKRYVVMHGADYVSQDTINAYGYLGNSEGCPAVSHDVNHQVIDWMKGKGVLFITGAMNGYDSNWLNKDVAKEKLLGRLD